MALTRITVTGHYVDLDDADASGQVEFRLSSPILDSAGNEIVAPATLKAVLVAGAIDIDLPATDEPGASPTGVTYEVTERIVGAPVRQFSMVLPYDLPGATIDLADVAPVTDVEVFQYALVGHSHTGYVDTATLAESVQDIVGAMATDSATVDFTYDDTAGTLTASVTGLTSSSLSDFAEAVRDRLGATLAAGTGITVAVDDPGDTVTITAEVTQAELDAVSAAIPTTEAIQDAVGGALTDTATLDLTYNDGANTISGTVLDSPTVAGATPAQLRDRATHTGTQTAATVSDFTEAAQDAVGGALTDTATVDFTYNDGAGTIAADVPDNAVTLAKLVDIATARILGRTTAGTGDPELLTAAQAKALLAIAAADISDFNTAVATTALLQSSRQSIRKSAEESRTSTTTLADDATLKFTAGTTEAWDLIFALFVEGATTGDIKFAINAPAGSTVALGLHGALQSATTSTGQVEQDSVTGIGTSISVGVIGAGDGTTVFLAASVLTAGTGGTVALQWAQRISDATPTKIQAGSFLTGSKAS